MAQLDQTILSHPRYRCPQSVFTRWLSFSPISQDYVRDVHSRIVYYLANLGSPPYFRRGRRQTVRSVVFWERIEPSVVLCSRIASMRVLW